jgi:hypothetical protein
MLDELQGKWAFLSYLLFDKKPSIVPDRKNRVAEMPAHEYIGSKVIQEVKFIRWVR